MSVQAEGRTVFWVFFGCCFLASTLKTANWISERVTKSKHVLLEINRRERRPSSWRGRGFNSVFVGWASLLKKTTLLQSGREWLSCSAALADIYMKLNLLLTSPGFLASDWIERRLVASPGFESLCVMRMFQAVTPEEQFYVRAVTEVISHSAEAISRVMLITKL